MFDSSSFAEILAKITFLSHVFGPDVTEFDTSAARLGFLFLTVFVFLLGLTSVFELIRGLTGKEKIGWWIFYHAVVLYDTWALICLTLWWTPENYQWAFIGLYPLATFFIGIFVWLFRIDPKMAQEAFLTMIPQGLIWLGIIKPKSRR